MYRIGGKRAFDVIISTIMLVVLAPILLITAAIVRLGIGAPVFFWQVRPGLGARPFTLVKFRTMSDATDERGDLLPDAERLGRIGRLLRALSWDELPQFWNVLRGDMSLVGPRPLLMEYLPLYSAEQARRHEVRPGITGWAQVHGRNQTSWNDRLARDVWYVDHVSLLLDVGILLRTIGAVAFRRGMSAAGDVTMPKFTGSE